MKTKSLLLSIGLSILGLPCFVEAQIRDNDASMSALAVQCAVSSGYSVDEYEDYCRRLAKTLSMLSGDQQVRVFGYLPQPSGAPSGNEVPPTSTIPATPLPNSNTGDTATNQPPATKAGLDGNSSPGSVDTKTSEPGLLVGLIRELNKTIDGTVDSTAPIMAGATGVDLSGTSLPVTNLTEELATNLSEGQSSAKSGSGSSWDAFLAWFRETYKKG